METEILKINGLKHKVYTWGNLENPILFFIHGYLDTGASFNFIAEELSRKFYCIAFDLRGHGKSDHTKNENGYFFVEYFSDVHKIFNYFSPREKINVIGYSMGGNIISQYAGIFPDRVDSFINIEGFIVREFPLEDRPQRIQEWILNQEKKTKVKIYKKLSQFQNKLQKIYPNVSIDKIQFIAKFLSKKVEGGFIVASDQKHRWPNPYLFQLKKMVPVFKNIKARALIIWTENCEYTSWIKKGSSYQDEMKKRIADFPKTSQIKMIKNTGHAVHLERPLELVRIIAKFFEKILK